MSRFGSFESIWTRKTFDLNSRYKWKFSIYFNIVKYLYDESLLWNIDGVVHVLFFKEMNQLDGLADRRVDRSAPFGMSSFAED